MPRRLLVAAATAGLLAPAAGPLTAVGATAAPPARCSPARDASVVAKQGGDWSSYGHDLSNTRSQPAEHNLDATQVPTLHKVFAFSAKGAGGDGDFTGTPVIADGCLFIASTTGWVFAADAERYAFEGAYVLIETRGSHAGRILKKVYTVEPPRKKVKQGGATVWSTPAIDTRGKAAFVGTGNPFHENVPAKHADAVIKV